VNFSGKAGLGKFTFRGPFSDAGSVDARAQATGAELRVVERLSGRNGTLTLRWSQPCKGGAGRWAILSGTGRYRQLSGGGPTTHSACVRRLLSLHGVYAGTIKGYKAPVGVPPAPAPAPPSPAPPAPVRAAQDGHYVGRTDQGATIAFDVTGGGAELSNLTISLVHQQCSPADLSLDADADGGSAVLAADGSFSISLPSFSTTLDGSAATSSFAVRGTVSAGGTAGGTLGEQTSFTSATGAACDSGTVSWTAARGA